MDNVTKVRKYLKREQWITLIKECQSSGMTVTKWCDINDIREQTYYRNLKKFREEMCDSLPEMANVPNKPVAFKQLEVKTPIADTMAAVVIHINSATMEIRNGATQQTVEAVLMAFSAALFDNDYLPSLR